MTSEELTDALRDVRLAGELLGGPNTFSNTPIIIGRLEGRHTDGAGAYILADDGLYVNIMGKPKAVEAYRKLALALLGRE